MEISAVILRKDLVALHFYSYPRLRSNWVFFVIMAVGILSFILVTTKPENSAEISVAIFSALAGAVVGSLACLSIGLITILSMLGKRNGVLGMHHYTLSESGLGERTDVNENLQKWPGIQSIIRRKNHLFFRVNGYLFYIVPRRSFQTSKDFNSFCDRANELRGTV